MICLGIGGGSGSGKTTLAEALRASIGPERCTLLSFDDYYRDVSFDEIQKLPFGYDDPAALDEPLFLHHVDALLNQQPIDRPNYDFASHSRIGATRYEPAPVLIVEGILLLRSSEVRARLTHGIFVRTPDHIRVVRRIARDVEQRGREVRGVMTQLLRQVLPAHDAHVEPSSSQAGLVLPGDQPVRHLVEAALAHLGLHADRTSLH